MNIANSNIYVKIFALALFLSSVTMLFSTAEYHERMIITIDGKAQSTGMFVFSFAPENGESKDIKVTIAEKMGENAITKAIVKEFKVALGDAYKVHGEDGHKIKIKILNNSPKFNVEMGESTVQGVSLIIKKD